MYALDTAKRDSTFTERRNRRALLVDSCPVYNLKFNRHNLNPTTVLFICSFVCITVLVYSVLKFSAEFLTILNKQTAEQRGFPDIYMLDV